VLRERVGLCANETLKLSFRKSALHFFDAQRRAGSSSGHLS
jgi:hypothetical protein